MKATHIPAANGSNGSSIKDQVLGASAKIKAKLDSGPKAKPVEIKAPERAAADTEAMSFRQMLEDMGFKMISWKRTLLAYAASFLSGYLIGTTFSALFHYLFAASILASGWTFITIVVAVLMFVAAAYLTILTSQKIGRYIIDGNIDADVASLRAKIGGWFGRSPQLA